MNKFDPISELILIKTYAAFRAVYSVPVEVTVYRDSYVGGWGVSVSIGTDCVRHGVSDIELTHLHAGHVIDGMVLYTLRRMTEHRATRALRGLHGKA